MSTEVRDNLALKEQESLKCRVTTKVMYFELPMYGKQTLAYGKRQIPSRGPYVPPDPPPKLCDPPRARKQSSAGFFCETVTQHWHVFPPHMPDDEELGSARPARLDVASMNRCVYVCIFTYMWIGLGWAGLGWDT